MIGKFIHGDCMKGMKDYPDNHFDLAIVDPPYGIGMDFHKRPNKVIQKNGTILNVRSTTYIQKDWDIKPSPEYFKELHRISKNQIIWGANHFISRIPYDTSCWIVWDKVNSTNDSADCELAWTSFESAVRQLRYMWSGMMQGSPEDGAKMQGNKKLNEKRIHPTQKPVALYKWLLKNYAKEGDLILDTHVGSASSLIACEDMGFKYVAWEIDKDYYEDALKRLQNHIAQLKLEYH